jgi:hypothetical protein
MGSDPSRMCDAVVPTTDMSKRIGEPFRGQYVTHPSFFRHRLETGSDPITEVSRPSGLVELRIDRARSPGRHAGYALELLLRRLQEPFSRPEVTNQCPPASRPDPAQRVEDRLLGLGVAALPVEAEREAMSLIPNTLEKLQAR